MNASDLIEKLKELDPDAKVLISIFDGKEILDVEQVGGDLEPTKIWITLK